MDNFILSSSKPYKIFDSPERVAYFGDSSRIFGSFIDVDEDTCRNIKVGGISFDFICTKGTTYYAYFNTVPSENLTMKLWTDIEKATTKASPFYKNEYIICSVNRIPDGYWKLSKQFDNVHIVKLESLYACFMEDYNRSVHPRFVPSFVRNRRY